MENNEENLGSQEPVSQTTGTKTPSSLNIKPIAIIVAAIVILLVLFFMFFTRSAKSVVKDYVKAFSKGDAKKVMALMDYEGAAAFEACNSYSGVDYAKFDETYEELVDKVKELDKDQKKEYEEEKDKAIETLQSTLDLTKAMDAKMSVKNVKTEKVEGSKKLTKITATLKVKVAGVEQEQDVSFFAVKKGLKYYLVSAM